MDLGTVFKLSLYGLTAIVGAILGAAEGEGAAVGKPLNELLLPYLSLPVVICGYLITERRMRGRSSTLGLNSFFANLLGIIALLATGREFFSESREGKLLAGAHLLLYATWIVLFQRKTIRLYWFLMALGILQLAVSSVLTTKGWFGFSAVGYMFCAVWTLSIFSLWRAEQSFDEENQNRLLERSASPENSIDPWSAGQSTQSEVRSTVQHEEGTQWLTPRFVTGVLMTTCSALLVSTAFFAFIPRVWVGSEFSFQEDLDSVSAVAKRTGMPTTVRLGDLGKVLESVERVFEIQITNRNKEAIPIPKLADELGMAEPLFRGIVFSRYEKGKWSTERGTELQSEHFARYGVSPEKRDLEVKQHVRLEPTTSNVLFCLGNPLTIMVGRSNYYGEHNRFTSVITRSEPKFDNAVFEYTAISLRPSQHQLYFKMRVPQSAIGLYEGASAYLKHNAQVPEGLSRLEELSSRIIERETARQQVAGGLSTRRELTPLEKATALEWYLRESGIYKYSRDLSIIDSKIDPVEDFLINRKSGNCEYFATALALMIRSAKIPARVVSGYKGGIAHPEKNEAFEVQQRFAHLWVEAWVSKEKEWTTFDATPLEARSLSIADLDSKSRGSMWTGMQSTLSGLWSENVLNMSLARQEQSIYKPMRELGSALLQFIQQLITSPKSAFQTLWDLLKNSEQWLSIGGGLFALAFLLIMAGLSWLARRILTWLFAWYTNYTNLQMKQRRRIVAFYERFLRITRARGLKRETTQTQHEFAEQVTRTCLAELSDDGLENAPDQISRLFYRVRFGDESPSVTELNRLEDVLTKLEQALSTESNHSRVANPVRSGQ